MIWQHKDCPLCGQEMKVVQGDPKEPLYLLRCPTPMDIPFEYRFKIEAAYSQHDIASHFDLEFQNQKPYYQTLRLHPFCIKGYHDAFNIYKYDERMLLRYIAEIPAFDISWKDQEKIIKKLSTYTLFS